MPIKKIVHFAVSVYVLLSGFDCSAITVFAQHDIDGGSGRYTAFPNIYLLNNNNQLGFSVTARSRPSHHDSSGERIVLSSANCGITWQSAKFLPPPMVFADAQKGAYTMVNAAGWRALDVNKSAPDGAYVSREKGKSFVAQGVVERHSIDYGRSWKTTPLSVPKHAVMMNYNLASNLRTSQGSRITALYYQETITSRRSVLFAHKLANSTDWRFVTLPNGDEWPQIGFNETALSELPDGRIIAFLRPDPDSIGYLFYSISKDQGQTWSKPSRSQVYGYPASVILHRGKLLVTVGVRRHMPFSIEVYILDTKDILVENHFALDTATGNNESDFGYPITVSCNDNLVTTYYVPGSVDGTAYSKILVWKY